MSDVTDIDKQHQELVKRFNKLNDAVKNNQSREEVYRIIDDVIAFTRLHFDTEERIMIRTGYPEIEAHREKHQQLVKEALHLREKLDYVGERMFSDWFNHWPFARVLAHIQYADKQVEDHIAKAA